MANRIETIAEPPDGGVKVWSHRIREDIIRTKTNTLSGLARHALCLPREWDRVRDHKHLRDPVRQAQGAAGGRGGP